MNINHYVFEESYLININYKICDCIIILTIDAKKSIKHPKSSMIKSYEDSFEEIEIIFTGVQYYRGITSTNILNDPNDDIGSIHELCIGGSNDLDDGVRFEYANNLLKISMENHYGTVSEISSKSKNIKFLEFVSEMISFRAGFSEFQINITNN